MEQILTKELKAKLQKYLDELYRWNKRINLTAVPEDKAWETLIEPSLKMIELFPATSGLKVFDIGSGSGIPGIVLALAMPGNTFFLVEAVQKKSAFLIHASGTLGMENLLPLNVRTEEAINGKLEYYEAADVVTSRQVAPATVFEAAETLLPPGGTDENRNTTKAR